VIGEQMTTSHFSVVLLLLTSFSLPGTARELSGSWSTHATGIWAPHKTITVPSPDGTKKIVVQPIEKAESDATTNVSVRAFGHTFKTRIGEWVNAEVLWSPDSRAFAVTYSDGGAIGTYHVTIVQVTSNGLRYSEPVPNGRSLFVPQCFDAELPNVAAIRWQNSDSSRLLIAIQVPPHSSCASMGTFHAFEISTTDASVVAKYGQLEAKKKFAKDIGVELANADDSCINQPSKCVPSK
jgi:hypothetical protein